MSSSNGRNEVEIVIIEDNPSDAELLMRVFRKHNVSNKIILLEDGAQALDFFFCKDAPADAASASRVIILDLKLPKVHGIQVLRRLKSEERTRKTPVVVLTSSREDRDLKEAYESGVNSYVTKPIHFEDFAKVVSEMEMYWLLVNMPPRSK